MIFLKNNVSKVIIVFLAIIITAQYINLKLEKYVFAETTRAVIIETSILFNSDLDASKLVDGRDLSMLMYFFGKTESEYSQNGFKVNPDINGDKIVDGDDLVILASHFGLEK